MRSARVWEDCFSDLEQTRHPYLSVEDELVRGRPDLQNPAVVCPEIERFIFLVFFGFFIIYGIFSKMKKSMCQWVEIGKKIN